MTVVKTVTLRCDSCPVWVAIDPGAARAARALASKLRRRAGWVTTSSLDGGRLDFCPECRRDGRHKLGRVV